MSRKFTKTKKERPLTHRAALRSSMSLSRWRTLQWQSLLRISTWWRTKYFCVFRHVSEQSRKCYHSHYYRGADKSLARPGRKQATPVKSVMGRGMDW